MSVRFFRDRYGFPRAATPAPYESLAGFLEQDIQSDTDWGRELIEIIDAVEAGSTDSWEGTGNAYTVTLMREGAVIKNEFADPSENFNLPLADLKAALQNWIAFIEEGSRA